MQIIDGTKRGRPGKWIVDYVDRFTGRRRWVTCRTEAEAVRVEAEVLDKGTYQLRGGARRGMKTFSAYVETWFERAALSRRPDTVKAYTAMVRNHVIPSIGDMPLGEITRSDIKSLIARSSEHMNRGSLRVLLSTINQILEEAFEDGLIGANPTPRAGRIIGKARREDERPVKAMNAEQAAALLDATMKHCADVYPLLFTLTRTGMRIGEACALEWKDVDLDGRRIYVRRSKTGKPRDVDIPQSVVDVLRAHDEDPEYVFPNPAGGPMHTGIVRRMFKRLLRLANLPEHFSPHSCRHGYASLMLQAGVSVVYVQRQLGHASIKMTVDTYGRWLPMRDLEAVDRLDSVIAKAGQEAAE